VWTKTLGGSGNEQSGNIFQTIEGGYIFTGTTSSYDGDVHGYHTPSAFQYSDIWVVKLNAAGDTVWTKTLGGAGTESAGRVLQTTDGGYILTGITNSTDGDVHGVHGGYDVWIVKLTPTGDTAWTKTLGGSADELASDILQTRDGGYIIIGNTFSNDGDITTPNHGSADLWIVKLTADGTISWSKTLGGSNYDQGMRIRELSFEEGGYIVLGSTNSNDGDVHENHGDFDAWFIKLTDAGDTVWTKTLGGSGKDWLSDFQKTTDGGFIMTGNTDSNDGDVFGNHNPNGNFYDIWVVKLGICPVQSPVITRNGDILSTSTGYIIYQWFLNGQPINGAYTATHTATANGTYTVEVMDANGCNNLSDTLNITNVGIPEVAGKNIHIYPNPATNIVHINAAIPVSATLSSLDGRVLLPTANTNQINISALAAGVYLLKIRDAQGVVVRVAQIVKL
jgi:hypothetical protein